MRYRSKGFTQRLSNIPLWYMWKLCSYTLSMVDQITFIDSDIKVFDLFHILNPNKKITTYIVYHSSHSMTWNSQVDCGTTD
jgi:hypothetical protein